MKYLGECNELYQSVVLEAERSLKVVKSLSTREMSLDHPAKMLVTHEVMPLHVIFNTGHEVAARNVTRALMNFNSPIDAAEHCIRKSRIYVNNDLGNIKATYDEQFNYFVKLIYFHSFIINGGFVEIANGSVNESKVIFKKCHNEIMYKFGEKIRVVDGYYLFIGDGRSTVVLVGKPIKNNETLIHVFEASDLSGFPVKDQVKWIEKCVLNKKIVSTSISYLDLYLESGSFKKFVKGIKA